MRKHLSTIIKVGVTLLGLAVVLTRFDAQAIGRVISQADPFWMLVGFLIAITLLTLSSMRATNIGLYMAQNEESRIAAEQAAQALADAIVAKMLADGMLQC